MVARVNEIDNRPSRDPSGTLGAITTSDATVLSPICCALYITATVAGNVAIRMLDGNVAIVAVPVGVTVFRGQFDQVRTTSTTATATYCALYNIDH